MGCFQTYEDTVARQDTWDVSGHLDAAAALTACLRHQIIGSGPLYHPLPDAKSFTESETAAATSLAKKVIAKHGNKEKAPSAEDLALLADEAYEFAIACLVARGAVHKGPPKVPK